ARVMYLDVARKGGATVRAVRGWRMQAEQFDALQASAPAPPPGAVAPPAQPYGSSLVCIICGENSDPPELPLVYLHRMCERVVLSPVLRGIGHRQAAEEGK